MVETSVILLNYNGLHLLKECLPAVLDQTYTDYEVILVDNGSTDRSKEWVAEHYPKSKYPRLLLKHIIPNRGYTGGNNYGVKFARGKYVVLLSNDTVVPRDWIEKLIAGIKREKDAAIVGSVVLTHGVEKDIERVIYGKRRASTMNVVCESVMVPMRPTDVARGFYETFYAAGNTLCYRKELWREPFDQAYFIYAEDIYCCWRARLQGWKVKIILDSKVGHVSGGSRNLTKRVNKIAVFNGMKNQIMNYLIFYRWHNILRMLPLFAITQVAHVLHHPHKLIPKLKVYWWVLRNLLVIVRKHRQMQRKRKVDDKEILAQMSWKFYDDPWMPLPPYKRTLVAVMNGLFRMYCTMVGVRTREYYDARAAR